MWDPYRHIWEVDKDEFLVKYREEKHSAADFESLIITYSNLANSIQIQETVNQVILILGIEIRIAKKNLILKKIVYHLLFIFRYIS